MLNIAEYESHAKSALEEAVWGYYFGGAWDEITLARNVIDYRDYEILYRVLRGVGKRNLSQTILGQKFASPIGICPLGMQQMAHSEGELGSARAAIANEMPYVLSTMSNYSIEQVGECFKGKKIKPWFQLYIHKDRALTLDLVKRAEQSGFSALFITVDTPVLGVRERDVKNSFTMPEGLNFGTLARSLTHAGSVSALMKDFAKNICPNICFDDVDWLGSKTKLPIILKGIVHPEDIKLAKDHGAEAALISNHGGRQLDGCISTIKALENIKASKYSDCLPLFIDGGIRRGGDVLKALALGAEAVFVGRPILWGLAHNGEQGVKHVLDILNSELDVAMALAGCQNLTEVQNLEMLKR